MSTAMLIFAGALVFAIGGTPLARYLAPRLGMMDQPSARKVHFRPIPRLGGVVIFGAVMLTLAFLQEQRNFDQFVSILLAATWMSFLGLWDDRWGVSPLFKLIGLFIGALFLLYALGTWSSALSGRLADRYTPGRVGVGMTLVMLAGLLLSLPAMLITVLPGVALLTIGFFAVHATNPVSRLSRVQRPIRRDCVTMTDAAAANGFCRTASEKR